MRNGEATETSLLPKIHSQSWRTSWNSRPCDLDMTPTVSSKTDTTCPIFLECASALWALPMAMRTCAGSTDDARGVCQNA